MGAKGSFSSIAIREEVVWGQVDPGQFDYVNFTSEDMAFNISNQSSNNIRPDRQTTDLIQIGADTSGGFETEFQATNIDKLLPGFFWDTEWHTCVASDTLTFTAEASQGAGGTIAFAAGAASVSTLKVGQVIKITGSASNSDRVTVKAIGTSSITTAEPLVTEAAVACTMKGDCVYNGVTRHSFSIVRANEDISQFFLYKGMVPNTLEFNIEDGSPVTTNLSFVGKDEVLTQTTPSTGTPNAASITSIINAVASVSSVKFNGVAVAGCLLQSLTVSINNKVAGKTGVGTLGYCDADAKSLDVMGTISLYFNDATYYNMYRNSQSFSISIDMQDNEGNFYNISVLNAKFDKAPTNVTGKDDDVMMDAGYVAIVSSSNSTVILSRISA